MQASFAPTSSHKKNNVAFKVNLFPPQFFKQKYKLNGIIKSTAEAAPEGSAKTSEYEKVIAYDKHVDLPLYKTYGNDEFLITRSAFHRKKEGDFACVCINNLIKNFNRHVCNYFDADNACVYLMNALKPRRIYIE